MGSDANACVRGVGDSCRSSFLFCSNEHNYTRRTADASLLAAVPRLFSRSVGQGMARPPKTILMCSCEDTMRLDTAAVKRGCRNSEIATFRQLCRAELDQFRNAAKAEGSLTVGCTQEAPLFSDEAGERAERIDFVNLRETAGWSTEGAQAGPKMAALLAAAAEPAPDFPLVNLSSEGVILIYGRDESAVEAGRLLADHLDVTVMITRPAQIAPPAVTSFPIVKGTIRNAKGHFGAFELTIDDYAAPRPSSRDALIFEAPRNGATSRCDLVLDLSGGPPLFPAHDLRDGYLRADPRDPSAMLRAVLKARDLVGSFDKPKYINFTAELCAHSRSNMTGCHRCLDLCPTSAITPDGDHVRISAEICAGCGQCAAACPTGAASYALPPADTLLHKLRAMLLAYDQAGGSKPIVMFHDGQHGTPLIDALARHGDRPAGQRAAACRQRGNADRLGSDRRGIRLRRGGCAFPSAGKTPARRRPDFRRRIAMADAILSGLGFSARRVSTIETDDPDVLGETLRGIEPGATVQRPVNIQDRRQAARSASFRP